MNTKNKFYDNAQAEAVQVAQNEPHFKAMERDLSALRKHAEQMDCTLISMIRRIDSTLQILRNSNGLQQQR